MDSKISEAGIPKAQIKIPQKATAIHSVLQQTNKHNKNPHTARTLEKQPQDYITHTHNLHFICTNFLLETVMASHNG